MRTQLECQGSIEPSSVLCILCLMTGCYILSHESPSSFIAMQIFTKLCCRLPGSIVLLIAVCVAAQQVTQQPAQRPRRVNGSEQTTEPKKTSPQTDEVDEGDVVRVETQLVSVPAVVTDSSGRPLSGLKPENFRLVEDGQPQTIANFGTTETPFEIALLLDTSGSTRDDVADRKSTRLNSSHTEIYTLSLHDALPIYRRRPAADDHQLRHYRDAVRNRLAARYFRLDTR